MAQPDKSRSILQHWQWKIAGYDLQGVTGAYIPAPGENEYPRNNHFRWKHIASSGFNEHNETVQITRTETNSKARRAKNNDEMYMVPITSSTVGGPRYVSYTQHGIHPGHYCKYRVRARYYRKSIQYVESQQNEIVTESNLANIEDACTKIEHVAFAEIWSGWSELSLRIQTHYKSPPPQVLKPLMISRQARSITIVWPAADIGMVKPELKRFQYILCRVYFV